MQAIDMAIDVIKRINRESDHDGIRTEKAQAIAAVASAHAQIAIAQELALIRGLAQMTWPFIGTKANPRPDAPLSPSGPDE
jgi:hypothetical protein